MSLSRTLHRSLPLQSSCALPRATTAAVSHARTPAAALRRHLIIATHSASTTKSPLLGWHASRPSQTRRFNSEQPPADEEILVPELGDDVKDAVFIKWVKPEGAAVEEDEVVGTIETDKVACDVRAPNTGTLHKQLVTEGTKVKVGQKLAIVRRVTAADESESNANDTRRAKSSGGTPVSGGQQEATVTVSSDQPEGKGSNRIKDGRVAAGPKAGAFKPKSEASDDSYSAIASHASNAMKAGKRSYSTSAYRGQISGDPRSAGSGYGKSGQSAGAGQAAKDQAKQDGKPSQKKSGAEGNPQSDSSKQQFYGVPDGDAPHSSKGTGKSNTKGVGPGKPDVQPDDMQKGGSESSYKKASPTSHVDDGSKTGDKDKASGGK